MTTSVEKRVLRAGVVLGIGLGGFIDGIVLHQILQVHNMLSAKLPPITVPSIEINMFWDGMFHAFTWLFTLAGLWLLWRALRGNMLTLPGRAFAGALLFGWALFNLVEGAIDHHILHLHHVVERMGFSIFDYAFMGLSLILLIVGVLMMRVRRRNHREEDGAVKASAGPAPHV